MNPKRILIVSTYFPPQPFIAALRAYSFARYWADMGHKITVLTTRKYNSFETTYTPAVDQFEIIDVPYLDVVKQTRRLMQALHAARGNRQNGHKHRTPDADRKHRISFLVSNMKALIDRLRGYGFYTTARIPDVHDLWIRKAVLYGKEQLRKQKYDWIFSTYGPPASHVVAGILKKSSGCKWVADYRDLWLEGHVYPGLWPFTALERYLENKYVGGHADIITTVSEPLAAILRKKFCVPVHVIENGFDEEDYKGCFSSYFDDKKKRIIYTGTIYEKKQDPSPLFAALSSLVNESAEMRRRIDSELEVLFFGNKSSWLEGLIRDYHLQQWVKYAGMVGREDILRVQHQSDILLFLDWEDERTDGILTGKIFEYMATRKPILAIGPASRTMSGDMIERAGVGISVGKDTERIRNILVSLLEGRTPFPILPNEEVIQRYTRRKQAERLLNIMIDNK